MCYSKTNLCYLCSFLLNQDHFMHNDLEHNLLQLQIKLIEKWLHFLVGRIQVILFSLVHSHLYLVKFLHWKISPSSHQLFEVLSFVLNQLRTILFDQLWLVRIPRLNNWWDNHWKYNQHMVQIHLWILNRPLYQR